MQIKVPSNRDLKLQSVREDQNEQDEQGENKHSEESMPSFATLNENENELERAKKVLEKFRNAIKRVILNLRK